MSRSGPSGTNANCPDLLGAAPGFERSSSTIHSEVDLITQDPKIYRLGEKRFGAALQSLALGLGITVGGDHDDRNVGPRGLRFVLGNSSKPLIPGMLMSETIRMSETSAASVMR